ncbi:hypothetical protein QMK33_12695 [Hymenobacter sp. H14-R3]|uniref:hypothetical protein n=1 Tax=Hymenobacter sp. H14-R3 TaxID=3046308 RepID=UPI0024BABA48|nr:hypothetical protein [Hymenobacter sp. H14-R3]MDJ0366014.1 hypothetical protein [Hymenobacter sp. H14-R3]
MRTQLLFALLGTALSAQAQTFDFKKEFPYKPLTAWTPGMRFLMPDLSTGFDCPLMVLKGPTFVGTDLYGTSPDDKALKGTTFTFARLDGFRDRGYNNKDTGSNTDQVAVVFKNPAGKQYAHIIRATMPELKGDPNRAGGPCLINLEEVEKARRLLVGQTLYVLQAYISSSSTRDNVEYLPKYVPVKITKVGPGEGPAPVRLTFEYVGQQPRQVQEQNYVFSGTNGYRASPDGELPANAFLKSFSFSDPRSTAAATGTSATKWKAIQQGNLVKGMSMKEVEQVMGKPKRQAESMEEERMTVWYYSRFQGKEWTLLFKNGILERYTTYQE